jgi:cellulose synthase/poly-beta-1,6-N-acetylglucosamine synthase-like glycosyltransferase
VLALDHDSFDVLVVDNSPGDQATARAAASRGARCLTVPAAGLSRARNHGARAAHGDIVAFVDDDAVPHPLWLRRHEDALRDPALAATTGRVITVPADGPVARAYATVGGEDLGTTAFSISREHPRWFEMANFGGVGLGANMAFRRSLFESGWGFPEWLGLGAGPPGEEHYAFFTLIRDGGTVAYLPDAIVHHDAPATMADLDLRKQRILRGGSAYMTMLVARERGYRLATLRYALGALRGTRRSWRPNTGGDRFVSRRHLLANVAIGQLQYLRALRTGRRIR